MGETVENRVRAAQDGDPTALEGLLVHELPNLRGFVRLRMGPALRELESTSDVVQSVCREVLQDVSRIEYRGESSFRHWLYLAAERKLKDRARHWGRAKRDPGRLAGTEPELEGLLPTYAGFCSPSEAAIGQEQLARVEAAFDKLPDSYREAILLSRVVGLSNQELAEELGHEEAYTRTLLSRALVRLASLMEPV